jgi:hypothetical protein
LDFDVQQIGGDAADHRHVLLRIKTIAVLHGVDQRFLQRQTHAELVTVAPLHGGEVPQDVFQHLLAGGGLAGDGLLPRHNPLTLCGPLTV